MDLWARKYFSTDVGPMSTIQRQERSILDEEWSRVNLHRSQLELECGEARAFLVAACHWLLLNKSSIDYWLNIDSIVSCPRERCAIAGNVENIKEHVKNVFQACDASWNRS